MARLYADENFHLATVTELRKLGHDVLTAREAGQAGQRIPDSTVLGFATQLYRAVLTHNRRHFIKLHKQTAIHSGIVICTYDSDFIGMARRIHHGLMDQGSLDNQLVRVNKPTSP